MTELLPAMPDYKGCLDAAGIKEVEDSTDSVFVGEFPLRPNSVTVGTLFYEATPKNPEHNQYFFVYRNSDDAKLYRTTGEHMDNRILCGVVTSKNNFIYSRGRHDLVKLDDCMVDGGDGYMRCNLNARAIYFQIKNGKLIQLEGIEDEPRAV